MQSTLNMTMKRPQDLNWWDDLPAAVRVEIAPTKEELTEMAVKPPRAGCGLIFFGALIRIYCFAIGVLMIAFGGWILYQISTDLLPLSVIAKVASGVFLVIAGLLTVLAETRNRRTMANCVNTYVFLSNHWARGVFYVVVGALTFSMDIEISYIGNFGKARILAGFMVAGGLFSLMYAPFRYRYLRQKSMAVQPRSLAYGEEVAYQMNITHVSQINNLPIAAPQPIDAHSELAMEGQKQMYEDDTNGAGIPMEDLKMEKGKMKMEKEKSFHDIEMGGAQGVPVM